MKYRPLLLPMCLLMLLSGSKAQQFGAPRPDTKIVDHKEIRERPFILVGIDKKKQATIDGVSFSDAQFSVLLNQLKKHEPDLVLRLRAPKDLLFSAGRRLIRLAAKSGIPLSPSKPGDNGQQERKPKDKKTESE